jgi:hypothetical protein
VTLFSLRVLRRFIITSLAFFEEISHCRVVSRSLKLVLPFIHYHIHKVRQHEKLQDILFNRNMLSIDIYKTHNLAESGSVLRMVIVEVKDQSKEHFGLHQVKIAQLLLVIFVEILADCLGPIVKSVRYLFLESFLVIVDHNSK